MDCGGVFVKYVLFIFNILFVICGVLLITFGSIMVASIKDFSNVGETFTANSVAIIILVLGCLIFLVAFMGCCGAIRENACCLTTYSSVMMVLLVGQLALIIYVWIDHVQIQQSLEKIVQTIWDQRKSDSLLLDTLQRSFKCCGLKSYVDYVSVTFPASCCDSPSNSTCSITQVTGRPGCLGAVDTFWDTNVNIIKYAGLGVTAIELVAFIFGCCLANQTRNSQRRQNY
ncbi:23 kDa integral membrane protein [Drosophila bipectinata]|uniref:23 kDa integral membrane protein n=1 Tax=Drosophila bipectinata TaxID=42026 RepID=UPI0007E84FF3|nr:23 kDa integral membrane protein [Drosophila bipectinata]